MAPIRALTSVLTVLTVLVGFLFFQVLIFESRWELISLGLLLGAFSFGLFSYSLRTFTLKELGIVKKDWKKQIVYGILLGLILYAAFVVYRFILSGVPEFSLQLQIDYVGVLVIFAVVMSEEFFFRGYAIPMLERQIGTMVSYVISSIFFSVYHQSAVIESLLESSSMNFHWNYEYALIQFAGGLLLSFLFVKKRSLIMPITVHFTWDLLVLAGMRVESLPIFP